MARADQAERRGQRRPSSTSASAGGQLAGGARHRRQPDQGAVLAHRSHEAARAASTCRPCIPPAVAPKADAWTLRHLHEGCRGLPQGRRSRSASVSARPRTRSTPQARFFQSFGAVLVDAKGNVTVKIGSPCARRSSTASARPVLSAGRAGLGRCLQQQVARLGQGRADHEPAERLGGRQARCAAGRRAMLDARHSRPGRRAASHRSCPTSGASGTSARTSRRPRACCVHLVAAGRPSRRWWRRAGLRPAVTLPT